MPSVANHSFSVLARIRDGREPDSKPNSSAFERQIRLLGAALVPALMLISSKNLPLPETSRSLLIHAQDKTDLRLNLWISRQFAKSHSSMPLSPQNTAFDPSGDKAPFEERGTLEAVRFLTLLFFISSRQTEITFFTEAIITS